MAAPHDDLDYFKIVKNRLTEYLEKSEPYIPFAKQREPQPIPRPGKKSDGQGGDGSALKPRWELLPINEIEEIVKVLTMGAAKYGDFNWQDPKLRDRCVGAAYRHMASWMRGDKTDSEFGTATLAHACCCLLFVMHFDRESVK